MKFTSYDNWEQYKEFFMEQFPIEESYVICGVGGGYHALIGLFPEIKVRYCLDAAVQETCAKGGEVYPYKALLGRDVQMQKFIITAGGVYYSEIKNTLLFYGVQEENICSLPEILFFWGIRYRGKVFAASCNVILLTHCNLRCKSCSQLVPYVKNYHYSSAEKVKSDLDRYFHVFDYVKELVLVGGETFLYKDLAEVARYIKGHFPDRYYELKVFTNGTIVPNESVIESLSELDRVRVWISDYTCSIKREHSTIIKYLEKYKVPYTLNNSFGQSAENRWFDLGDPFALKAGDAVSRFRYCSLVTPSLWDHKIYYCAPSCGAALGDILPSDSTQVCLDLALLERMEPSEQAERIGKFSLGFLDKGYLEFCRFCNGFGTDVNQKFIQAGEQC